MPTGDVDAFENIKIHVQDLLDELQYDDAHDEGRYDIKHDLDRVLKRSAKSCDSKDGAIMLSTKSFHDRLVAWIRRRSLPEHVEELVATVTKELHDIALRVAQERTPWKGRRDSGCRDTLPSPSPPPKFHPEAVVYSDNPIQSLPAELRLIIARKSVEVYYGTVFVNSVDGHMFHNNGVRWRLYLNPPLTTMCNIQAPRRYFSKARQAIGVLQGACYAVEGNTSQDLSHGGTTNVRDAFFQSKLGFRFFDSVKRFMLEYCVLHAEGDITNTNRAKHLNNFAVIDSSTWENGIIDHCGNSPHFFQFETFYYLGKALDLNTIPYIVRVKEMEFLGCCRIDDNTRMVFLTQEAVSWTRRSLRHEPEGGFRRDPNDPDVAEGSAWRDAVDRWTKQDAEQVPKVERMHILNPGYGLTVSFFWDVSFLEDAAMMAEISRMLLAASDSHGPAQAVLTAAMPFERCTDPNDTNTRSKSCIFKSGASTLGARAWFEMGEHNQEEDRIWTETDDFHPLLPDEWLEPPAESSSQSGTKDGQDVSKHGLGAPASRTTRGGEDADALVREYQQNAAQDAAAAGSGVVDPAGSGFEPDEEISEGDFEAAMEAGDGESMDLDDDSQ